MDTEHVICVMEQGELKQKRNKIEYTNDDMEYIISQCIHSERDREILRLRYIDGIHIEPLAEKVGLTPRQVGNILRKHEAVIFKHFA